MSFNTWSWAFLLLYVFRNFLSYHWGINFAPIEFASPRRRGTVHFSLNFIILYIFGMRILAQIRKNSKNRGYRNHLYRYSSDLYRYRFDFGGLYRYRSRLYRYSLATASPIPVQVQRCTGTSLQNFPINGVFTIFHALIFHNSLLFHSSSRINMKSFQTTPQLLLISQRIQGFIPKFTQFYQTLEL